MGLEFIAESEGNLALAEVVNHSINICPLNHLLSPCDFNSSKKNPPVHISEHTPIEEISAVPT